MSENDLREGLRVALADEPTFDIDAVVDRARTAVARRRWAMVGGAAGAVVVTLAVVLPTLARKMPDGHVAAAFPGPSATSSRDLSAKLISRVRSELPQATDVRVAPGRGTPEHARRTVRFALDSARLELVVVVHAPGSLSTDPTRFCPAMTQTCEIVALSEGRIRVVDRDATRRVWEIRPDRTVVAVSGSLPDTVGDAVLEAVAGDPAITA
ncbi:hypothetical protein [Alloactinosynnema sp. L-07]|uniref:hypothetical protein n=1 Tax=Alloactinosynnema sp. L-07 TaxID=1653480 RepID=UPI00065EFB28|nr:hypothetical protein [Alloactinosynnema sp. L-07]CRK60457.1 hypothetical protein [Alloactinosynnema sp. L-07]